MSELNDKGPAVLTTLWALTSTACIFVAARLLVRLHLLKKAGWDDVLITLSMLLGYAYAAVITVAVHSGYGKHASLLSPDALTKAKWYNIAGFIPGLLSIVVPKLAVVALLVRTMNPSRRQKCLLWGMAVGSGLLLMGCVVILYVQCKPSRALWVLIPGATCWGPGVLVNYSIIVGGMYTFSTSVVRMCANCAAIAAAVDAYLAIYPAQIIWNLHMSLKKKIGLSLALGLGACACVMAVVKCTRLPSLYNVNDSTYATADLFIWTSIESNTIIIAACVPTIAPLIEITLGKRILNSTDKDSGSNRQLQEQPPGHTPGQVQATQHNRARAWMSSINVEQSYHQCSVQRASWGNASLEGCDADDGGIQRTDDFVIEYQRWPVKCDL